MDKRSLAGYSPESHKESDTSEQLSMLYFTILKVGRGENKNRKKKIKEEETSHFLTFPSFKQSLFFLVLFFLKILQ